LPRVFTCLRNMQLHLLIFVTLLKLSKGLLNCDIIKNRQPVEFDLSQDTISATKRNNSDVYQVFTCTCPTDTSGREGYENFGDSIKKDLDTYYYSKDEKDWAESQLIRITKCNRLVVSLGSDAADAIHKTLSLGKVAILFEDIQELELASLDVGHSATPTNKRAVVTSLLFRNLVISKSPYNLKIEDKTEFHLSNVTFTSPVFLDVYNRDSSINNPTVIIKDSKFPAKVDIVSPILVGIITALVTALLTGLIVMAMMKFACNESNRVQSSGKREA